MVLVARCFLFSISHARSIEHTHIHIHTHICTHTPNNSYIQRNQGELEELRKLHRKGRPRPKGSREDLIEALRRKEEDEYAGNGFRRFSSRVVVVVLMVVAAHLPDLVLTPVYCPLSDCDSLPLLPFRSPTPPPLPTQSSLTSAIRKM